MPTKNPRILVTVDDDLFEQIEDFRFENRFQSRNAAMVALMRAGFEAIRQQEAAGQGGEEETDEKRKVHKREETKKDDLVDR